MRSAACRPMMCTPTISSVSFLNSTCSRKKISNRVGNRSGDGGVHSIPVPSIAVLGALLVGGRRPEPAPVPGFFFFLISNKTGKKR